MKRFEQVGLSRDQAEAMTKHVTRLILGNKDQLEQEFVSRTVLDRVRAWPPSGAALLAFTAAGGAGLVGAGCVRGSSGGSQRGCLPSWWHRRSTAAHCLTPAAAAAGLLSATATAAITPVSMATAPLRFSLHPPLASRQRCLCPVLTWPALLLLLLAGVCWVDAGGWVAVDGGAGVSHRQLQG